MIIKLLKDIIIFELLKYSFLAPIIRHVNFSVFREEKLGPFRRHFGRFHWVGISVDHHFRVVQFPGFREGRLNWVHYGNSCLFRPLHADVGQRLFWHLYLLIFDNCDLLFNTLNVAIFFQFNTVLSFQSVLFINGCVLTRVFRIA